ncbi:hypothetical protein F5Y19DRAFT_478681 [Xylariaceae sp. FL1651]|nr:hypothetical protein F5Y19DRAFT_478681 [Xylariaceae sp. FL1651]
MPRRHRLLHSPCALPLRTREDVDQRAAGVVVLIAQFEVGKLGNMVERPFIDVRVGGHHLKQSESSRHLQRAYLCSVQVNLVDWLYGLVDPFTFNMTAERLEVGDKIGIFLQLQVSQLLWLQWNIVFVAKPDLTGRALGIDTTNEKDLAPAFVEVLPVDAYSVHPQLPRLIAVAESLEPCEEVSRRRQDGIVHEYVAPIGRVTPDIAAGLVAWIVVE